MMDTTERILAAMGKFKEGIGILESGPAEFYFEKMKGYANALFEQFAPWKASDRVVLTKPTNGGVGWRSAEEIWLKPGAIGTVHAVDFSDRYFTAAIEFDDESWMDSEGRVHPVAPNGRHLFRIDERFLELHGAVNVWKKQDMLTRAGKLVELFLDPMKLPCSASGHNGEGVRSCTCRNVLIERLSKSFLDDLWPVAPGQEAEKTERKVD